MCSKVLFVDFFNHIATKKLWSVIFSLFAQMMIAFPLSNLIRFGTNLLAKPLEVGEVFHSPKGDRLSDESQIYPTSTSFASRLVFLSGWRSVLVVWYRQHHVICVLLGMCRPLSHHLVWKSLKNLRAKGKQKYTEVWLPHAIILIEYLISSCSLQRSITKWTK